MIELRDLIATTGFNPIIYWVLALFTIPLLSFFSNFFIKSKAPIWATTLLLLNTGISLFLVYAHWYGEAVSIKGVWFSIGDTVLNYSFYLDRLALIMLVLVNGISFLVHLFSIEYMRTDRQKPKYFAYLGLFTFSMIGVVLFHNLLLMFVFWELVGLSSFLLIGFWFDKKSAALAANKAFLINRIGDVGLLTGLMILYSQFQTFDLEAIRTLMVFSEIEDGNWIAHFTTLGDKECNT